MIVIVEGPDNSGKSTLIATLGQQSNVTYVPMLSGRTQPHELSRKVTYDTVYNHKGKIILCERFYPMSDTIYRLMDGGPRMFSKIEAQSIYKQLYEEAAIVVIYCRPPVEAAEMALHVPSNDDDEDWLNFILPRLKKSYEEYDKFMAAAALTGIPVIHYDYTSPWAMDIAEGVMNYVWA